MTRLQWKLIQDCAARTDAMVSWEQEFIADLQGRGEDGDLTEAEARKLAGLVVRVSQ